MTVRSINPLSEQQVITSAERMKNEADLIFLVQCIPRLHGFRKCTANSFGKRQLVLAMSLEEKPASNFKLSFEFLVLIFLELDVQTNRFKMA